MDTEVRELLPFLVPLLLILSASMAEGGTWPAFAVAKGARRGAQGQGHHRTPTPLLPRDWPLPEGWNGVIRSNPDGSQVEMLSSSEPGLYARVYSWPAERASATAHDARRLLTKALAPSLHPAGSRSSAWEVEATYMGWNGADPRTDGPPKRPPDLVARARCAKVEDRLVAAVVLSEPKGGKAGQARMDELLARCTLRAPRWRRRGVWMAKQGAEATERGRSKVRVFRQN